MRSSSPNRPWIGWTRRASLIRESRVPLGKTGMGVAVRAGTPLPDLSTPEAFKQALLGAKSVVYGDPTLPNQSGEKAERILVQAGLRCAQTAAQDRSRASDEPGTDRQGRSANGIVQHQRNPGGQSLAYAGPVPKLLQIVTNYEGALMSDGSVPEAARAFIRFLAGPDARGKWVAAKLKPPADR